MNNRKAFVLADWGTSNLRVWIVSDEAGTKKQIMSPRGAGGLLQNQFYDIIKNILRGAGVKLQTAEKLPVIICGMAGSRNGWKEASYLPAPVSCFYVHEIPTYIQTDDLDIYILPGVAQQSSAVPDVMRGEETQLLGLCVQHPYYSGMVCLPGTHSKWVVLENGVIKSFHTAMTGELFALLVKQSVLRHVVGESSLFELEDINFKEGVLAGYNHPERIVFDIFAVRARGLLFSCCGAEAAARLSGMLIGAEISASLKSRDKNKYCALVATGRMQLLYKKAFDYLEYDVEQYDADQLVQIGLNFAAQKIINKSDLKNE